MQTAHDPDLEISATEARDTSCPTTPIFDLRDEQERNAGVPAGAQIISIGELLEQATVGGQGLPRKASLICAEGVRSLAAARQLHEKGFTGFRSIVGGYRSWLAEGLPVVGPDGLDIVRLDRYARHLVMPQVGPEGQSRLLGTRVLLAGLGGLNSPAALYLAAAGIGTLGLADPDRVERSNLQRQVLHGEQTIGEYKTRSARKRIEELNPDVKTVRIGKRITAANAADIVAEWDIVVDGTDNFPARYALNTACIQHDKPLVYGAVMRFQGQVSVFWPAGPGQGGCFQCLMPEAPAAGDAPSCSEAGVLGVLPGIVGTLQAAEALKLALGVGQPLCGRLLLLDALSMEFREMRLPRRAQCPACGGGLQAPG